MATAQELEIHSAEDFENLPEDGFWEVANGRAMLLPGNELDHQGISIGLVERILAGLKKRGRGRVVPAVNVDIPPHRGEGFRTRVPDLLVYETRPSSKRFGKGEPPDIAIEILSTRRGNIERTEKIEDYARAGIAEYWIVDPFERAVEVYRLEDLKYNLAAVAAQEIDSRAMPCLVVDLRGLFDLN